MSTPTVPTLEVSAARYLEIGQHLLFGVLLTLGAVRTVHVGSLAAGQQTAVFVAAALTAAWYVAGALVGRLRAPGAARLGWFAVLLACWIGLLVLSPDFSWVAFALFLMSIHLLPGRSALVLIAALTCVVVGVHVHAGVGNLFGQVAGPVVGAVVAAGTGLLYRRILAESEQRRRLVAELLAAQDDLVAVHDELASTQREAGVHAERARLARDIHDTLAQGFSAIVLLSRAGLAAEKHSPVLAQIESTALEHLEEARRVVHALTPASLESAPLPAALARLVARLEEQTGISASLDALDVGSLPTAHEVALLRIAQSALANVRLHSGAARVGVTLTQSVDRVTLEVVDDGRGFDPEALRTAPLGGTGFGLRAMRERLAGLGGTLGVESTPGEGTVLTATIPLADAKDRP